MSQESASPPPSSPPPRLVIVGCDNLTVRLVEELSRLEEQTAVVVSDPDDPLATQIAELGAQVVVGSARDIETLVRAGVPQARALALIDVDDVGNMHTALAAQELNPQLRLVVRMFNRRLGERMERLFDDCTILSASAITAPFFVDAALGGGSQHLLRVADRLLSVGPPEVMRQLLIELGRPGEEGPELLPSPSSGAPPADLVLGFPDEATTMAPTARGGARLGLTGLVRRSRLRTWLTTVSTTMSTRVRWTAATFAALVAVGAMVFHSAFRMSWLDAFYAAAAAVATGGIEEGRVLGATAEARVFAGILVVSSIVVVAVLTAFVVDDLVGARLARSLGAPLREPADHIVVCGLGTVGLRVAEQLRDAGISVVGIEQNPDQTTRVTSQRLGVPVIHGDASEEETLRVAGVSRARCLIAVTNDDIANLEAGLASRTLRPDIRVVLRLFDSDLADRVDRRLGLSVSRSVSAAAAPVFAAAIMGREVIAAVPYGRRVLLIAAIPVEEGSPADGMALESLEAPGDARVFGYIHGGEVRWGSAAETVMVAGDQVLVVTTRAGLARTLLLTGIAAG